MPSAIKKRMQLARFSLIMNTVSECTNNGYCRVLHRRTCPCAPSFPILLSVMSPLLSSFFLSVALMHAHSFRIPSMYLRPRSQSPGPSRVAYPNARNPAAGPVGPPGSSCVACSMMARPWYERAHGLRRETLAISGAARFGIVLGMGR
jgi:ribosomal protein L32